ncbi:DUF6144 family protein [Eubacterium sp. 1001713B170207_170306_E7]|uniref:DUF6144 family protein n=1 Tax=Eubacterium sp. 1001713B170207_170306_E7 TaxID=2787097 RepID=UPI001896BF25|nr:DUF6144 family protein [Eubacterium sp. 1001713B170207_170306_E7]
MKNFSMPETVSPFLEQEELERLSQSLEKNVSREAAEALVRRVPLRPGATPKERAEWVNRLSEELEASFDRETIIKIRMGCHCNENGRLEETAEAFRALYQSNGQNLERFVSHLNKSGAGWRIKGDALYTKMFTCECPMLEKAEPSPSLTWCYCTAGYSKAFFEAVFERPVEVELLQTIKQGHDCCLLKITGIL